MAILHNKEFKIATVLEKLPKKYNDEQFVEKFIKLYSKEWGKIKSAYIKQSQDKEPGTVINMPKPELYLKQLLKNYLNREDVKEVQEVSAPVVETAKPEALAVKKPKVEGEVAKKTIVKKAVAAKPKKEVIAIDETIPATEKKVTKKKVEKKA